MFCILQTAGSVCVSVGQMALVVLELLQCLLLRLGFLLHRESKGIVSVQKVQSCCASSLDRCFFLAVTFISVGVMCLSRPSCAASGGGKHHWFCWPSVGERAVGLRS